MCNRKLAAEPAVPQYALVEKECVPLFVPCFSSTRDRGSRGRAVDISTHVKQPSQ